MKMLNVLTSRKNLPHTSLENQQTHFDSVRLLKGAPPGRKQVNYYTGELAQLAISQEWQAACSANHLMDVMTGNYSSDSSSYGLGGPSDQKFYDADYIKAVTNAIKFKDPQRVLPVL